MFLRDFPWRKLASYTVAALVILLVVALIVPAIHQAQIAARRSTSRNNLKQLGIAFHNYHATHNCLPPGGWIADDGSGYHGWGILTQPFLDASPLYAMTDFDHPWDYHSNDDIFRTSIHYFLIPGNDAKFTAKTGYGLSHHMANPSVFHRNSSVTFDDCTAGLAHTWFHGEASGNYSPWGYPYNWRPLGTRLNAGPNGFGHDPFNGAHLMIGDGSIRHYSNETDLSILKKLAKAPPIADPKSTARPDVTFEYSSSGWRPD